MDRNQVIGLVLIFGLLLLYFQFFAPTPTPTAQQQKAQTIKVIPNKVGSDTLKNTGILKDSLQQAKNVILENKDVKITLTSQGGRVKEVLLKNYKTHLNKPVILLDSASSQMSLKVPTNTGTLDLYARFYEVANASPIFVKQNDTAQVKFLLKFAENQYVEQIYSLAGNGYQLNYQVNFVGVEGMFKKGAAQFDWKEKLKRTEPHLEDVRNISTVNYYTTEGDFDYLSETSKDPEYAKVAEPIKWIAFKQKFFILGMIAQNSFTNTEVKSEIDFADSNTVKTVEASMAMPVDNFKAGKTQMQFYFGPNHFPTLKAIDHDFSRNVYLGWTVFRWVNRFLIIPIFQFCELFISNYGLIIILLVLIVKLLLFPLSYKSYISMAKTKVLKPEIDLIKEKHKGDMQKVQADQMELYRKVGINPLSGCIPMLLQIPILFALFTFFPNAIELRQQPFLWANDLSTYDSIAQLPFNIPFYGSHVSLFTILMTISTLVYTWFNNQMVTVEGPMKMMGYIMPVIFMFILNSLPAGLSFYYFVSNVVTIGQQLVLRNFVNEEKIRATLEENKVKNKDKKKSSFQSRLEDALKAQNEAKKKKG